MIRVEQDSVLRPKHTKNNNNKYKKSLQYISKLYRQLKQHKLLLILFIVLLIPLIEASGSNDSQVQNTMYKETKCTTRAVREVTPTQEEEEDIDLDTEYPEEEKEMAGHYQKLCNSCRMREEVKNISLEAIKGDILAKLGMSSVPNITSKMRPKIEDARLAILLQRFESEKRHKVNRKTHHYNNGVSWEYPREEMMGDQPANSDFSFKDRSHSDSKHFVEGEVMMEEEDDYHIKTEKVIAFAQPYTRLRHAGRIEDIQRFQFGERLRNNRVTNASIWIYIRGRQWRMASPNSTFINIAIYRILKQQVNRESPVLTPVISNLKQPLPNGDGAWVNIAVYPLVQMVTDMFKNPHNNHGIVIRAEDEQENNMAVTSHKPQDSALVPFLEIQVTDLKKHRMKRTLGLNCHDSSNETRCCKYPLTVDFEQFGWDWIIAPKKYDANYCSGDCPFVFMPRYPHTHIVQQANLRVGGGPCCAPRQLSAISMLYFDQNNNIIYGNLPSMVVDRCGCM